MTAKTVLPAIILLLGLLISVSATGLTLPTNTVMDNLLQLVPIIGTKMAPLLNHPLTTEATNRLRSPIHRTTIFVPAKEAMDNYEVGFGDSAGGSVLFKHHMIPKYVFNHRR